LGSTSRGSSGIIRSWIRRPCGDGDDAQCPPHGRGAVLHRVVARTQKRSSRYKRSDGVRQLSVGCEVLSGNTVEPEQPPRPTVLVRSQAASWARRNAAASPITRWGMRWSPRAFRELMRCTRSRSSRAAAPAHVRRLRLYDPMITGLITLWNGKVSWACPLAPPKLFQFPPL
jgi:hypothetical protein